MLFQQGSLYRFSCSNILRAFCFESVYENIGKNHCNITAFKSKFFFFFFGQVRRVKQGILFCFVFSCDYPPVLCYLYVLKFI